MIVISGASASGKTATANNLEKKYGIKKVTTSTTRDVRVGEVRGVDYFFYSKDEFKKLINENKLVEYTLYNDNYYGTEKSQIDHNKAVVVDTNGLKSYIDMHNPNIVTFFLTCNDKTRRERMNSRGDKESSINQRMESDCETFDLSKLKGIDFIIETEDKSIEEVTDELYKLYRSKIK